MKNFLIKKKIINHNLYSISSKGFKILTPEEYIVNYKNTLVDKSIKTLKLNPLPSIHDPELTDVYLSGLPKEKISNSGKFLLNHLSTYYPDLIFLQIDPMPYVTRQRYLSHKCALNNVEGYDIKGVENLNEPKPISFEECIVDLLVLDMASANQVPSKLDYTKGFVTYNYPNLQLRSTTDNITDKLIGAITNYIVADKWSPYHEINQLLYECLMGKQKVLLGDMPEILLRRILGNTLSIKQVRDIFKLVLNKIEDLGNNKDFLIEEENITNDNDRRFLMNRLTNEMFSHIFQAPKDLYMTALIKNTAVTSMSLSCFVGQPHLTPIKKYWTPPPDGINLTRATTIPERIENETNEDLIEKQAIFDILLGTRLWSEKYIFNPFPYIEEDITKISNLDDLKKTFFINLKKYEMLRNSVIDIFVMKKIEFVNKHKEELTYKETVKLTKL